MSISLTGGPNFLVEPILQKVWIIWCHRLYLNFKSFADTNSYSFIRFQCIPLESGVFFPELWNFYKLRRGDLISLGNQFCRKSALFGPPFSISVLKVLQTKSLRHWLDFNAFTSTFLRVLKYLQIKEGRPNFWVKPILQNVWIIWYTLLYFDFQSFPDQKYSSFIRLQWILHDSGVLF